MESISLGVPVATWPMHSDQPRNAFLITEVLKIGLVVNDWEHRDELVSSEVVEDVVKRLIGSGEGEEMRKRTAKLEDRVFERRLIHSFPTFGGRDITNVSSVL